VEKGAIIEDRDCNAGVSPKGIGEGEGDW